MRKVCGNIYVLSTLASGLLIIYGSLVIADIVFLTKITQEYSKNVIQELLILQTLGLLVCIFRLLSNGAIISGLQLGKDKIVLCGIFTDYTVHSLGSFVFTHHVELREKEDVPFQVGKETSRLIYVLLALPFHFFISATFDWVMKFIWERELLGLGEKNVKNLKENNWRKTFYVQTVVTTLVFLGRMGNTSYTTFSKWERVRWLELIATILYLLPGFLMTLGFLVQLFKELHLKRLQRFRKYYLFWVFTPFYLNPLTDGPYADFAKGSISIEFGHIRRVLDILCWNFSLSCYAVIFVLVKLRKEKEQSISNYVHSLKEKRNILQLPAKLVQVLDSKPIGTGHSSKVYQGVLTKSSNLGFSKGKHLSVAIKVLHSAENCVPSNVLAEELQNMERVMGIGGGRNFVNFYGACLLTSDELAAPLGKVNIVMEFCPNGSLLDYVQNKLVKSTENDGIRQMISWCHGVAEGMRHLANSKLVHGDLAARNILLGSDLSAKISDFGMSIKLYEYQTYATSSSMVFPWRWLAPESLESLKFSIESDIWSYGVLIWEVFSFGQHPYENAEWCSDFSERLRKGERLKKPDQAPEEIHRLMTECWNIVPNQRPTFSRIVETLDQFVKINATILF